MQLSHVTEFWLRLAGNILLDLLLYVSLARWAVAERTSVPVHAYKFIGEFRIHLARELHRVIQSFLAMLEAVGNTVAYGFGDQAAHIRTERAAHRVAAKRQGKIRKLLPPDTEIDHFVQSELRDRELTFVD